MMNKTYKYKPTYILKAYQTIQGKNKLHLTPIGQQTCRLAIYSRSPDTTTVTVTDIAPAYTAITAFVYASIPTDRSLHATDAADAPAHAANYAAASTTLTRQDPFIVVSTAADTAPAYAANPADAPAHMSKSWSYIILCMNSKLWGMGNIRCHSGWSVCLEPV